MIRLIFGIIFIKNFKIFFNFFFIKLKKYFSRQQGEQEHHAATAEQIKQHSGDEMQMATQFAMLVDCISNCMGYVSCLMWAIRGII